MPHQGTLQEAMTLSDRQKEYPPLAPDFLRFLHKVAHEAGISDEEAWRKWEAMRG